MLDRVVVMRCHGTQRLRARRGRVRRRADLRAPRRWCSADPRRARTAASGSATACAPARSTRCTSGGERHRARWTPRSAPAARICVPICPKDLFTLYPRNRRIELSCVARDKQAVVRATCMVGCTLCRKCVAKCPAGAIDLGRHAPSSSITRSASPTDPRATRRAWTSARAPSCTASASGPGPKPPEPAAAPPEA